MQESSSSVRVNVKLCGCIPRKDMADELGLRNKHGPLVPLSPSDENSLSSRRMMLPILSHRLPKLCGRPDISLDSRVRTGDILEPPSWAVAAKGESRLEPVCEAVGRQTSVDLSTKASFRIGRSPTADVQLLHTTSSRQHALMFHHSNGSCYIVDCGSSHGTYVNGSRISSAPKSGIVVPVKVRRGSLIRFGGPGAPSFVLKSFSFKLGDVVEPVAAKSPLKNSSSTPSIIQMNTRLNALGTTAAESVFSAALSLVRKRSFEETSDDEEPCSKRMRCLSPPLSPEQPIRLVSPDPPISSKKRVSFSPEPPIAFYPSPVTPEESSCEEDNCSI